MTTRCSWDERLAVGVLVLVVTIVAVALGVEVAHAADCTVVTPTRENTAPYPESHWHAAGFAAGEGDGDHGPMPVLVIQAFAPEQAVLDADDTDVTPDEAIENLGGCYGPKQNVVQLAPNVPPARRTYILIHELVHARLHHAGVPVEQHHCWMAEHNVSGRILGWMARRMNLSPAHYPRARFNELISCRTTFRLEYPPAAMAEAER